ncbi:MAG: GntR family transcriptional regulator [Lactobacillus iners]|nr:GntR family transcriptional regulator [Lactobacillus iners]
MKFEDNLPIYYQIEQQLYYDIVLGKLQPGEKMPSVRQLALDFTVNINTAQHVLPNMQDKGIIYSKRGLGSFVTDDVNLILVLKDEIISKMFSDFLSKTKKIGLSNQDTIDKLQTFVLKEGPKNE